MDIFTSRFWCKYREREPRSAYPHVDTWIINNNHDNHCLWYNLWWFMTIIEIISNNLWWFMTIINHDNHHRLLPIILARFLFNISSRFLFIIHDVVSEWIQINIIISSNVVQVWWGSKVVYIYYREPGRAYPQWCRVGINRDRSYRVAMIHRVR